MSDTNSLKAVIYAFSANLGIALAKTGAAVWTGSGSLLAEAIHSYADSGNQILLLIGMKRAEKLPTDKHPMGYAREPYIWSMMVAFTLFSVGGVFSIHEGWQRISVPHPVENGGIAVIILLIAIYLEWFSLKGALSALQEEKGERSLWQWFRETRSSELMVVTGEDIAALVGLLVALLMLVLTMITGNTAFDAAGSIIIGMLLITVAWVIGKEVHSLLIGESNDEIRDQVRMLVEANPNVQRVLNIWAINHGDQVLVALKAELNPEMRVLAASACINALEKQIHNDHPSVQWIFFEIDTED